METELKGRKVSPKAIGKDIEKLITPDNASLWVEELNRLLGAAEKINTEAWDKFVARFKGTGK